MAVPETLDQLVCVETKETVDKKELKVLEVAVEKKEAVVVTEKMVDVDPPEKPEMLGPLDQLAQKESPAKEEPMVHQENVVPSDPWDQKDPQEPQENQDNLVSKVEQVQKEAVDPVVTRVIWESQDKVVKMEPEDLLDPWELPEPRVTVVTLDLQVLKVPLAELALVEHKDPKETVEQQDLPDQLDAMDPRVLQEISVNLVAPD